MPAPLPKPLPEPDPPRSFLFSDEEMAEITDQEKRGIYTAERLAKLWPKKLESILKLLSDRWPIIEVARTLNVSEKTVVAVADRHADAITELDANFSKKARRVAWYQLDRVERNPGIIPPQAIAQSVKYFYEVGQLADGRPTEIHEERVTVDIYDHWARFVRGEVIGLAGGKLPPINGTAAPAAGAELAALPALPGPSGSGLRSEENGQATQGNGQACNMFCDTSGTEKPDESTAAPADTPGGGMPGGEGGAMPGGVNGSRKILPNEGA